MAEADSILSSGNPSLAHTMPLPAHTHLSSCSAGQQPRKAVSQEPFWDGTLQRLGSNQQVVDVNMNKRQLPGWEGRQMRGQNCLILGQQW